MSGEPQSYKSWAARALTVAAIAAGAVAVLFLIWHLSQMLLVIFAGVMFAILLDGVSDWLGNHLKLPKSVAMPLVLLVMLVLLAGSVWMVGPQVSDQFAKLTERIPEALRSVQSGIEESEWGQVLLRESPQTQDLLPVMGTDLLGRVTGAFSSALGFITGVAIVFFVGIYLAASPGQYEDNLVRLAPKDHRQRAKEVMSAVGRALRWWLAGRVASMVVIGILVAVGLWIAGIPLALTLGLIAAVLSFIPFIGPVFAAIPMILVALAEDPVLVIWAVVVYMAVQALESYFITPMIQKQAVFIPPALLITVQILMSVLFGILGMLLATPLALVGIVMIQMLYVEDVLHDDVRIMGHH
ncbi:AI-2E family transporter [candidate division GN15 bacterium]|nr:AI-2E family transporter [candidate division GN15 bacterium]